MQIKQIQYLFFTTLFSLILAGCASTTDPWGAQYEESVIPGKTKVLNMTGKSTTDGATEIYFGASSRVEMMVTFKDRLIAFQLDGENLPGAKAGHSPTGYQAVAVNPGVHTISYCHTTKSTLGSGVVMCDFVLKDFNFEPNARYMVVGNIDVRSGNSSGSQTTSVRTKLLKLN